MTTTGEIQEDYVFVAECSGCGARIATTGQTIGGEMGCTHQFGAIGGFKPKKQKIVYPSDAERNWLRIVDQNKEENIEHYDKFEDDKSELAQLKDKAMQDIATNIKELRAALDKRMEELEEALEDAYTERDNKIKENMKALEDHKGKNEETKEDSEDLLLSDMKLKEREKKIVSDCEQVINTTPQIKYVETELRYTFDQLKTIKDKIAEFGKLRTKKIGSGKKCDFKSTKDATNAPTGSPKKFEIDNIVQAQLRNTSFDDAKQKIKIGFRMKAGKEKPAEIDINKHLHIQISCRKESDDEKAENVEVLHEELVKLADCQTTNNTRYTTWINKKFDGGLTVAFKIKAKFVTPDDTKYVNSEGSWSREQEYEIPEEGVTFKLELDGDKQELCVPDDDKALTDFEQFKAKFLSTYSRKLQPGESLLLMTTQGVVDGKSALQKFATDGVTIKGIINAAPKKKEEAPPVAYGQPASPKAEEPRNAEVQPGGGGGGGPGAAAVDLPKNISIIAMFKGQKKRVVLKKKSDEYNMDGLRAQIAKKFSSKGLSTQQHYSLTTKEGQKIQYDQDILTHLNGYKGELIVEQ